jgi:arylsulfatase A-like enzyme/tetratricopeptide (TPR) repeat protein
VPRSRRKPPEKGPPATPRAVRARTRALLAFAGLAFAGAAAWALRPTAIQRDPQLSVLLVTIDTLRADALGAYGKRDAGTPWIDRLAREGVRFADVHAHNVVTLPSHANILSGRYPQHHGVRDNSGFRFPRDAPTAATLLEAAGWRTGAFVSAFVLDSRFGLDAGFDAYDDKLGGAEIHTAFLVPDRPGALTVEAARAWLEAGGRGRSFCWVHLYEPHFPYAPPEPFASRFRDQAYQGEVAAADAALEPLLRPLLEKGAAARTLVVLTSDHGESLGEHGERSHGIFAYEATLRVPLILWAPGLLRPRVVTSPASHVDVLPTLLDAVGQRLPEGLDGRSLLAAASGRPSEPEAVYFEALSASLNRGWAPLHGVLAGGLKYVDLPEPELYDLARDPAESQNRAAAQPGDLERLRAVLGRLRAADRGVERTQEDASVREHLSALGYVSGDAPRKQRYTRADDPKNLVELDARLDEVVRLYTRRDYDAGVALCREILRAREDMPVAQSQLAVLERARGNVPAALAAARRALELRPSDAEAAALLGVYLIEAGRAPEALALLAPFLAAKDADVDVLTAAGMAQARLGQPGEALATFSRARAADPTSAMVLVNTATVHIMSGDLQAARQTLDAALGLDPRVAKAHNELGVIAARGGRWDEAIEHWRRAAELDPSDYQTLFNLGATLRDRGRAEEARPYLEAYLQAAPPALEARDIARVRTWLASAATATRSGLP